MKTILTFCLILTSLSSYAQTYSKGEIKELDVEVAVNFNFKNCRDGGYLAAAYSQENEWVIDFTQNDNYAVKKFTKSYAGYRLDSMTANRKFSFQTTIHPDVNYAFRLREQDSGLYGDDDLYVLDELTPSYEIDEDLTCLGYGDCRVSEVKFTQIVPGKVDGKNCLEAIFTVQLK
ncbi:hypothetical protein N9B72_01405 [Bacteriovoracaceae bacterium]|nr:hypothetical protein [Bacteriovoracaceae bacterium]